MDSLIYYSDNIIIIINAYKTETGHMQTYKENRHTGGVE